MKPSRIAAIISLAAVLTALVGGAAAQAAPANTDTTIGTLDDVYCC